MDDRAPPPVLARRLRRLTAAVVAVALVTGICGFLPGSRVYADSRNCFGVSLSGLFHTEKAALDCTPSYDKLTAVRLAGGPELLLYLVAVLAPAIAVYRRPRRRRAWFWAIWTVLSGVTAAAIVLNVTFRLDILSHVETLWPSYAVEGGLYALNALLVLVLPGVVLVTRDH